MWTSSMGFVCFYILLSERTLFWDGKPNIGYEGVCVCVCVCVSLFPCIRGQGDVE